MLVVDPMHVEGGIGPAAAALIAILVLVVIATAASVVATRLYKRRKLKAQQTTIPRGLTAIFSAR